MSGVPLALNIAVSGVAHAVQQVPFFNQVAELICDVFDDCGKNFRWQDAGMGGYVVLHGSLDSVHHIKMTIGSDATAAILFKNLEGRPVEELSRVALRNACWSDFQGWIFQAKTLYENIQEEYKTYEVMKRIGIFDDPSQNSVNFHQGERVHISGDFKRIRLSSGTDKGPWIHPSPNDRTSNLSRCVRKGWFRAARFKAT